MEKLKRHTLNGSSLEWVLASDVEKLEAAKREDEARIAELLHRAVTAGQDAAYVLTLNPDAYAIELRSQLTTEQQAHAETRRQLGEVAAALRKYGAHDGDAMPPCPMVNCTCGFADALSRAAALARQASTNRPTDKQPTDERGIKQNEGGYESC